MNLDDDEVRQVLFCVGETARARAGAPLPQWLIQLRRRLELEIVVSEVGHRAEPRDSDSGIWLTALTARETASVLRLSERQARRLVHDLDAQIIGGRWMFPRAAVAEYAEACRDRTGA